MRGTGPEGDAAPTDPGTENLSWSGTTPTGFLLETSSREAQRGKEDSNEEGGIASKKSGPRRHEKWLCNTPMPTVSTACDPSKTAVGYGRPKGSPSRLPSLLWAVCALYGNWAPGRGKSPPQLPSPYHLNTHKPLDSCLSIQHSAASSVPGLYP